MLAVLAHPDGTNVRRRDYAKLEITSGSTPQEQQVLKVLLIQMLARSPPDPKWRFRRNERVSESPLSDPGKECDC